MYASELSTVDVYTCLSIFESAALILSWLPFLLLLDHSMKLMSCQLAGRRMLLFARSYLLRHCHFNIVLERSTK